MNVPRSIAWDRVRWRAEHVRLLQRTIDRCDELVLDGRLGDDGSRSELATLRRELARAQRNLVQLQREASGRLWSGETPPGPLRFLLRRAETACRDARRLCSSSARHRERSRELRRTAVAASGPGG